MGWPQSAANHPHSCSFTQSFSSRIRERKGRPEVRKLVGLGKDSCEEEEEKRRRGGRKREEEGEKKEKKTHKKTPQITNGAK